MFCENYQRRVSVYKSLTISELELEHVLGLRRRRNDREIRQRPDHARLAARQVLHNRGRIHNSKLYINLF